MHELQESGRSVELSGWAVSSSFNMFFSRRIVPFCTLASLGHHFDVLPDLVALLSEKPRLGSGVKADPGFAWRAPGYFSVLMHQRCLGQDLFICRYVSYYFSSILRMAF